MRRRRRWSTIGQRRLRSRVGQVSAVATILALMLMVSYIASNVVGQLPAQMSVLEFQHVLVVESQMIAMQTRVQFQAGNTTFPFVVTSPITLGSQANPPFGLPATGALVKLPISDNTTASFALTNGTTTVSVYSGVVAHLYNIYITPYDVAYDQGAVILASQSGASTMLSGPPFSYSTSSGGNTVSLTLVNAIGNVTTDAGRATAGVTTQVQNVQSWTYGTTYTGGRTLTSSTAFTLTVATPYPGAWAAWFDNNGTVFPTVTCETTAHVAIAGGCSSVSSGTQTLVLATVSAIQVTFNEVTISETVL
jgi:hypothetical protein